MIFSISSACMPNYSHLPNEVPRQNPLEKLRLRSKDYGKNLLQRIRNTVGSLSRETQAEINEAANTLPESIKSMIAEVDTMHRDLKMLVMNELFKLSRSSKRIAKAGLPLVATAYLTACGTAPNVIADFSASLKGYETRLNETEKLLQTATSQLERQQTEMTTLVSMINSLRAEGELSKETVADVLKVMNDFKTEISNNTASFEEAKERVLTRIAAIENLTTKQQEIFTSALTAVSSASLEQQGPADTSSFFDFPPDGDSFPEDFVDNATENLGSNPSDETPHEDLTTDEPIEEEPTVEELTPPDPSETLPSNLPPLPQKPAEKEEK